MIVMRRPNFIRVNGHVYQKVTASGALEDIFHDSSYKHDGIQFYVYVLFKSSTGGGLDGIAKKVKKSDFNNIMDSDWLTPEQKSRAKAAYDLDGSSLWKAELVDQGWFWRQRTVGDGLEQRNKKTFSVHNIDKVQKVLNFIEKCRQEGGGPVIYARVSNKLTG